MNKKGTAPSDYNIRRWTFCNSTQFIINKKGVTICMVLVKRVLVIHIAMCVWVHSCWLTHAVSSDQNEIADRGIDENLEFQLLLTIMIFWG